MIQRFEYKGFVAAMQYAGQAGMYVGEILHIPKVIAFSAASLEELKELMVVAVEEYLLPATICEGN